MRKHKANFKRSNIEVARVRLLRAKSTSFYHRNLNSDVLGIIINIIIIITMSRYVYVRRIYTKSSIRPVIRKTIYFKISTECIEICLCNV